jgi:hypothetical protein
VTEQSLDDIMSGRGNPVSDETTTTTAEPAAITAAPEAGTGRDELGRFAPKPGEPGSTTTVEPTPTQPNGHVPIQALDAERNKRKDIEDRYDREMREMREQISRLAQPKPTAEPPAPPPSMFDDPDAYLQHQMSPLQSALQEVREELWETKASSVHTAEAVQAAKVAAEALFGTPEGAALHQQITASGNPFENLVKWHKKQQALAEVGEDPEAYFQRRLAEMQSTNQSQTTQQPQEQPAQAPIPTSFAKAPSGGPRGGPGYGGPRPLSEIMGGR